LRRESDWAKPINTDAFVERKFAMTVPRLPNITVPGPRPKLQKIALEEAYATKAGVKLAQEAATACNDFLANQIKAAGP
jgi:hypothetical protein